MKTQQKNNSISRKEIIDFICRLNYQATQKQDEQDEQVYISVNLKQSYDAGWKDGWQYACAYFGHELYKIIRQNDKHQR